MILLLGLDLERELIKLDSNSRDRHAVSVMKDITIVGHESSRMHTDTLSDVEEQPLPFRLITCLDEL